MISKLLKIKISGVLIIIVVVLLVASLFFFFSVRSLPAEVEEQNALLSYEHQGDFDYTVYLQPSYLYGPPPTEPAEDNQYPINIIDEIEFVYRYYPEESNTEVVDVSGILEDPDIWQKKIKVFPYTAKTGEFSIRFTLDIDEIEDMYDEIEDEVGFSASPRVFTIEVGVTATNEEFVHTLPLEIGTNLITIPADLKHAQDCGNGEFYYYIHLEENSLYGEEVVLEPPLVSAAASPWVTLEPGDVIFASLVDSLDVTYDYQFRADQPATEITSDLQVDILLEALSEGDDELEFIQLWSKEFPVLSVEEKGGDIQVGFPLDFNYYNEMINTIRSETGAYADSYNLIISASTHTVARTDYGRVDEVFTQRMIGNISGGILVWEEGLSQTESGEITETVAVPNTDTYMGLSAGMARVLSTVLTVLLFLGSLPLVALYLISRSGQLSTVENDARQVSNKYKQRISEAVGQLPTEGNKIISLLSMEDLIKVADELGKPVIHERTSYGNTVMHSYYIADGDTYYRYVIEGEEESVSQAEPDYRDEVRQAISEAVKELGHSTSSGEAKDNPDIEKD